MKILLIKLSAIGDLLAFSPIPKLIKETGAIGTIDHLVMEHCSFVLRGDPYIDKKISMPFYPSGNRIKDLLNFIATLFRLRRNKYDIAIIYHRSFLFQLLCEFAGIKKIYGYRSSSNIFLTQFLNYQTDINRTLQDVELTRLAGFDAKSPDSLVYNPIINCIPRDLFSLLPSDYVCLGIGGGNAHATADTRLWPVEYFISLVNKFSLKFVLLGKGESDFLRARYIQQCATRENIINLVNETSYDESYLVLKGSKVFIGNDSSLIFLAAASGIKTIGLYGPTQASAAAPLSKNHISLKANSPCAPCYNPYDGVKSRMYSCDNNVCMASISTENVAIILANVLDSVSAAPYVDHI